jgi:hypothetical protein
MSQKVFLAQAPAKGLKPNPVNAAVVKEKTMLGRRCSPGHLV